MPAEPPSFEAAERPAVRPGGPIVRPKRIMGGPRPSGPPEKIPQGFLRRVEAPDPRRDRNDPSRVQRPQPANNNWRWRESPDGERRREFNGGWARSNLLTAHAVGNCDEGSWPAEPAIPDHRTAVRILCPMILRPLLFALRFFCCLQFFLQLVNLISKLMAPFG